MIFTPHNHSLLQYIFDWKCNKKQGPGPLAPPGRSLPMRNMTARSYSCTTCFQVIANSLWLEHFDQGHLETNKEREGKGDQEHTPKGGKWVELAQLANIIFCLKLTMMYRIPRQPEKEESTKAHVICVSWTFATIVESRRGLPPPKKINFLSTAQPNWDGPKIR